MTGQDLLDLMEISNNELLLQSGETDVVKGLKALNVAQDFFESLLALRPNAKGDTTGTVTTTLSTETTAFPTGLLRLDRLQMIGTDSLPMYDLTPVKKTGGRSPGNMWPYYGYLTGRSGRPTNYYTNGRLIYWSPIPDAQYTVRWYGLQAASAITAVGTFAYDDIAGFPVAALAAKIMAAGVDDGTPDLAELAGSTFEAALRAADGFWRDGGQPFEYTRSHTT